MWLGIEEWHLDPVHRNAANERALGWNTRLWRRAQEAARRGDWAKLVAVFEKAKADPACPVAKEELEAVLGYLAANRGGWTTDGCGISPCPTGRGGWGRRSRRYATWSRTGSRGGRPERGAGRIT